MEDLYVKIRERLTQELPEVSFIDEDCGQLVENEEGYPVTFPCVLIDVVTVDWQQNNGGTLRGRGSVIVKLAFDCYEDTHSGAYTDTELGRRMKLEQRLRQALHRYCFGADYSPMLLTQSRFYTLYGLKKVYESTFSINLTEDLLSIK
ncbi:MAG: hypothetical protein RR410_04765 [Alistipes sp.]